MLEELETEAQKVQGKTDELEYINGLMKSIREDKGGLLRKQLKKWIWDDVGNKDNSKNKEFGQKYQPRAYRTYYELAIALVGWVDAKKGRREEKAIAQDVMQDRAVDYHLNSVFLHIREWIESQDKGLKDSIKNEIKNKIKIQENTWAVYQTYFQKDANNKLPNHLDVLENPAQYDIREKTGVLHDLMHYFYDKYGDYFLFNDIKYKRIKLINKNEYKYIKIKDFKATTLDGRKDYKRPQNTQICEGREEAKAGIEELDLKKVKYSNEEMDASYQYARRYKLPMYGRHSFTAARMMGLAKQTGANESEMRAVSWAIMAYWRLHYDHTQIPYHTTHEIMDFNPEFGIDYDPLNRFEGFRAIQKENFVDFLMKEVSKHLDLRAVNALIAYPESTLKRANYFLTHNELWVIPRVMEFLRTTVLPLPEYKVLSPEKLRIFFNYDVNNLKLLLKLAQERKEHVYSGAPLIFLKQMASWDEYAVQSLMKYFTNDLERAKYFLEHNELWVIPRVMEFLQTTALPFDDYQQLPSIMLRVFFLHDKNKKLLPLLPLKKKKHVYRGASLDFLKKMAPLDSYAAQLLMEYHENDPKRVNYFLAHN